MFAYERCRYEYKVLPLVDVEEIGFDEEVELKDTDLEKTSDQQTEQD